MTNSGLGWPSQREQLVDFQNRLRTVRPEPWDSRDLPRRTGACWICYQKGHVGSGVSGDQYWAAAVLLVDNRVMATAIDSGETGAPYEPGLLALREGPILERAVRSLPEFPEVLLVNATGRDHPRSAGLAVHLGFQLSLPTIGVTRNPLIASGAWPSNDSGALAPLKIDEEIVGFWLRSRRGIQPLAVHSGWRTSPETAVRIVRGLTLRWRTPEPLRQARSAARAARAKNL